MKWIALFVITMNTLISFVTHPISMMIMVFIQSLAISSMLFILHSNPWIALMLFLIFVGGLMILFVYISSLTSNEKFKIKITNLLYFFVMTFITLMFIVGTSKNFESEMYVSLNSSIYHIFTNSSVLLVSSIMIYLFLIMIIVTAISIPTKSPIRSSSWAYVKFS